MFYTTASLQCSDWLRLGAFSVNRQTTILLFRTKKDTMKSPTETCSPSQSTLCINQLPYWKCFRTCNNIQFQVDTHLVCLMHVEISGERINLTLTWAPWILWSALLWEPNRSIGWKVRGRWERKEVLVRIKEPKTKSRMAKSWFPVYKILHYDQYRLGL